jgi:hypothetical protein
MTNNTKKTEGSGVPVIPNGAELYDQIMTGIEPDLVRSALPDLKTKFLGGTNEEKKIRARKYAAAFGQFKTELTKREAELKQGVSDFNKETIKIAERFSTEMESNNMKKLEDIFNTDI